MWEIIELSNGRKISGRVTVEGELLYIEVMQQDGWVHTETHPLDDVISRKSVSEEKAVSFALWH